MSSSIPPQGQLPEFHAQLVTEIEALQAAVAAIGTLTGDNIISALPTSDPGVVGALWVDAGTVKVSAGP